MTDRITQALGEGDEDVMSMKAGIDGLVFDGWTDEDIGATAMEMARESRRALKETIEDAVRRRGA